MRLQNINFEFNKKNTIQMQKFQDLLTEAAQLKQQQLKQQRKNFEALPQYLKSGLNYAKKYVQLRKQHYMVQKYISQKLKKQGNDHYLLQNYGQALSKYQQALSVFRYIHATKYENLKDEDIMYENYKPQLQHKEEHEMHLVALYLNICSALTKMNKKDEAIHSSQQALKINQNNPKIYYKKAQAFLQYINRDSNDIKLGFYYLNKAYELSKDQSILTQMHKIKKELDEEREKEKNWFKFMFDKNNPQKKNVTNEDKLNQSIASNIGKNINLQHAQSDTRSSNQKQNKLAKEPKKSSKLDSDMRDFIDQVRTSQNLQTVPQITQKTINKSQDNQQQQKTKKFKQQFDRFKQQNDEVQQKNISQQQKLQKTKFSLKPYLIIPRDDRWLIKYQEDFIHKNGSKIYSILQLYNYSDYLIEYRSLLAKCLELKQSMITPQRDENKLLEEKIQIYGKFVQWIKKHPIQKYKRYIERYDLQTQWIQNNRTRPLDEVFAQDPIIQRKKQTQSENAYARVDQFVNNIRQSNNEIPKKQNKSNKTKVKPRQNDIIEEMIEKQEKVRNVTENKKSSNKSKLKNNINTHKFKQQWQYDDEDSYRKTSSNNSENDKVPELLKGFLQNYEDFPTYKLESKSQGKNQHKAEARVDKKLKSESPDQSIDIIKQNPFGFLKTFIVILSLALLAKLFF